MDTAVIDATDDLFQQASALAERLGGVLGFTTLGRLVITLPQYAEYPSAQEVADQITVDDFEFGYVVPDTDSILVFEF